MIDALRRDIEAARGPDRELDCRIHEVITEQIDEGPVANRRRAGQMLVDLGSERRFIDVPHYSANADSAAKLFNPEFGIRTSFNPIGVRRVAIRNDLQFSYQSLWTASLWRTEANEQIAISDHDASLALCLCLLAVAHAEKAR